MSEFVRVKNSWKNRAFPVMARHVPCGEVLEYRPENEAEVWNSHSCHEETVHTELVAPVEVVTTVNGCAAHPGAPSPNCPDCVVGPTVESDEGTTVQRALADEIEHLRGEAALRALSTEPGGSDEALSQASRVV